MDVQKKLDEIVAAVQSARSMPMSASCVVNRAELLGMLEEVRAALPESLAQAQEVLGDREQVVAEARREAERILASAQAERGSLISETQIARQSQEEAERILEAARREAAEIRAEADDYVDSKLANFEVVLTKTIAAVERGREKLLGRGLGLDENGNPDADAPERSLDPEELRRRADEYVDAKLASFEAVLDKTLKAVGRGRQKLLGRRPIDDLADYQAAEEGRITPGDSDAEYVAALGGASAPQQPNYDGYGYGYQDGGYAAAQQGQPQPQSAGQVPPQYTPAPDGYPAQPGYASPEYSPDYGWQQPQSAAYGQTGAYNGPDGGYAPQEPEYGQGGPAALDETSFFDTSMIDATRLRELDKGR